MSDFAVDGIDIESMRMLLSTYAGIENDEHGNKTPLRFLTMLNELTQCKDESDVHMKSCIKWSDFPAESRDMIMLESISFTSLCNHHLATFQGVAHVAYIPEASIAGLSKLARVVRHFARQAQVQERLTKEIGDYLEHVLQPQGVAVILRAEHSCMSVRGVQAHGVITTTSTMRGHFADHTRTAKAEFLQMIGMK
jgi:GTP cyclohydrolase I